MNPPSFDDHYRGIPAIDYAERLAQSHPGTSVIMCHPAPGARQGAFASRDAAVGVAMLLAGLEGGHGAADGP